MSEEASAVQIGQRRYRVYAQKDYPLPELSLNHHSLSLLDEDDGESEEEENFNVDVTDFENFPQQKLKISQEEVIQETIFYRPSAETYILTTKLPTQNFYNLCGGCSSDRTPSQVQIEFQTKAQLKGFPNTQTVEIKGNNYQQVVQAHIAILDLYKITPKPTEYQVMSDKLIAVVKGYSGNTAAEEDVEEEEVKKLEEYPKLEMKYDPKWQGFMTVVLNFPKECADLLLNDKGKNIKKLKSEMKGNVEFVVNKTENSLEIVGYTQEQVREGYAAFTRVLRNTRAADAFVKIKSPAKANLPQRIMKPVVRERKFTHFLSVGLENNPDLLRLQQQLFGMGVGKLTAQMVNPPSRFHITVAVLSLDSPGGVIECLNSLTSELQGITRNNAITLTFDRIGYFGKPNAATVLYVDILHDKEFMRFSEVSTKIHHALLKQGILTQTDLNKQQTELRGNTLKKQYHMTLAKNKGSSSFLDLTNILASPPHFSIPVLVTHVHLMSMHTESPNSSYPILFSKQLI